jgi:hypothetical protein
MCKYEDVQIDGENGFFTKKLEIVEDIVTLSFTWVM